MASKVGEPQDTPGESQVTALSRKNCTEPKPSLSPSRRRQCHLPTEACRTYVSPGLSEYGLIVTVCPVTPTEKEDLEGEQVRQSPLHRCHPLSQGSSKTAHAFPHLQMPSPVFSPLLQSSQLIARLPCLPEATQPGPVTRPDRPLSNEGTLGRPPFIYF